MLILQICNSFSQSYRRDSTIYENSGYKLILYEDSSFVYKWKGSDIARIRGVGDDTVSWGKYVKYKNKAFYLYSSPELMSNELNVIGTESFMNSMKDSIIIILSSPFTEQSRLFPKKKINYYLYVIRLRYKIENIKSLNDIVLTPPISSFSDTIKIGNINYHQIESIILQIYPYIPPYSLGIYREPVSSLYAEYYIQNTSSNCFNLHLPKLTTYYCFYDRFDAMELKRIDACTLLINNRMFLVKENCNPKWYIHKRFMRIGKKITNPYTNECGW
jgi:hypothetical protein